jgi:IMP dehydrogenase
MVKKSERTSRTLAEFRFIPGLTPEGLNKESIDLSTQLTRDTSEGKGIRTKIPVISAAMQSVTGTDTAVTLAQQGTVGTIFCSQPIEEQAGMVKAVKRARAGFVSQLEVTNPTEMVGDVADLIEKTGYNTIPVVEGDKSNYGKLLGVIEGPIDDSIEKNLNIPDFMRRFVQQPLERIVSDVMEEGDAKAVIQAVNDYIHFGETGISLSDANTLMADNRTKYLPIVNKDGTLKFMIFRKDLQAHHDFPNSLLDKDKRYIACAAINTHDHEERVPALVEAGVDVLIIDASDGFTEYQKKCIEFVKRDFPDKPIIAGNIVSAEALDYLLDLEIHGIKTGMGGGSICITQEQKGTGRGQATTIEEIAERRNEYFRKTGVYVPITADGGISTAKDIAMALAFGADVVMMGRYFAGCKESPNPIIERDGKLFKEYWGEGSSKAKAWLQKRYGQTEFEEGVVSLVPYTGKVEDNIRETFAKIRATMISVGARNIRELQQNAYVELISEASRIEGGVHDVMEVKI